MAKEVKKIKVIVNVKNVNWKGGTFVAYKVSFGDKYYDLRLTKGCPQLPKDEGKYIVHTDSNSIWNDKRKTDMNGKERKYPLYWIKAFEKVEKVEAQDFTKDLEEIEG